MFTIPRHTLGALLLTTVSVVALAVPASAIAAGNDADAIAVLQKKLDQSIKMIEALTARVQELESRQGGTVAATQTASTGPATQQQVAEVEHRVQQIEAANATRQQDTTGLPIHGFADVGIGNYNPYFANYRGANIGSLDFYLTPKLGDRVLALSELIFEVGPDGSVGTDLERFQIGYQFSDAATVWIGRFHTPYGYINTALHHGVWLADALRRPKFLNFEDHGGVMPSHTVGAWLTGAQRAGDGRVLYDLYVGNAQQDSGGTVFMQNAGTAHGTVMGGGRLSYQFTGGPLDGLTVGASAFTDKVDSAQTNNLTQLRVAGIAAVYDTDSWEHIAEAYVFHDTNLNGPPGTKRSTAWFAQLGYRGAWGVPYVRYERASLDQNDLYFAEQQFGASYYRSAAGVRFDINPKSAIKFELANTHTLDFRVSDVQYGLPEDYNEVLAQYAVRF